MRCAGLLREQILECPNYVSTRLHSGLPANLAISVNQNGTVLDARNSVSSNCRAVVGYSPRNHFAEDIRGFTRPGVKTLNGAGMRDLLRGSD